MEQAALSSQSGFVGSAGRWAAERFQAHGLSTDALRSYDTLRRDEWVHFLDEVVMEGMLRLRGVQDLVDRNLTRDVPNALGKTMIEFDRVSDTQDAEVSMDGISRANYDRPDFLNAQVPNVIAHKDFVLDLRTLSASRERGESLDTTQLRDAARRVAEKLEDLLVNGGPTVAGNALRGYTTHPNRNTASFGTNGHWGASAKTGENILADVLTLKSGLEADRYYGPYAIYVPASASTKLDDDFKANSDKTIRQRVLEVDGVEQLRVIDKLATQNVLMVQLTSDVVELADGEGIQPIQWDAHGGFQLNFKVMAIQVPLVKATHSGRSGVIHMS